MCHDVERLTDEQVKAHQQYLGDRALEYFRKDEKRTKMTQTIEGVPAGWAAVRFGLFKTGDYYLCSTKHIVGPMSYDATDSYKLVIVPTNVYGKILEDVMIPATYERAGNTVDEWFRVPRRGETFIDKNDGQALKHAASADFKASTGDSRRIIIQPIKPKTKTVLVLEYEEPSRALVALFSNPRTSRGPDYTTRNTRVEERPV